MARGVGRRAGALALVAWLALMACSAAVSLATTVAAVAAVDEPAQAAGVAPAGVRLRGGEGESAPSVLVQLESGSEIQSGKGRYLKKSTRISGATFSGPGSNGVTGTIMFENTCMKGYKKVTINLQGLQGEAGAWDLHEDPVPFNGDCTATGPRYRPKGNPIGDLSARMGPFTGLYSIENRVLLDSEYQHSGKISGLGRSLVIHRADTGEIMACATVEKVASG